MESSEMIAPRVIVECELRLNYKSYFAALLAKLAALIRAMTS